MEKAAERAPPFLLRSQDGARLGRVVSIVVHCFLDRLQCAIRVLSVHWILLVLWVKRPKHWKSVLEVHKCTVVDTAIESSPQNQSVWAFKTGWASPKSWIIKITCLHEYSTYLFLPLGDTVSSYSLLSQTCPEWSEEKSQNILNINLHNQHKEIIVIYLVALKASSKVIISDKHGTNHLFKQS